MRRIPSGASLQSVCVRAKTEQYNLTLWTGLVIWCSSGEPHPDTRGSDKGAAVPLSNAHGKIGCSCTCHTKSGAAGAVGAYDGLGLIA